MVSDLGLFRLILFLSSPLLAIANLLSLQRRIEIPGSFGCFGFWGELTKRGECAGRTTVSVETLLTLITDLFLRMLDSHVSLAPSLFFHVSLFDDDMCRSTRLERAEAHCLRKCEQVLNMQWTR